MIRQRIRDKSHQYFTFRKLPKQQRNQFFGATDALLDTAIQASDFSYGVRAAPESRLLLCYGFLQALCVQQDAVRTLSKAVGLNSWRPQHDPSLCKIRNARIRLCGHPAEADAGKKNGRPSSAIINLHDVFETHFQGIVYFEDKIEFVMVDIAQYLHDNKERLLGQMRKIETAMDEKERAFRSSYVDQPFGCCFGRGFPYLRERLHCLLSEEARRIQAESHAVELATIFSDLQQNLRSTGLEPEVKSPTFEILGFGLDLLQSLMKGDGDSVHRQMHFDLVYSGVEKYTDELIREIRDLDERLSAAV